MQTSDTVDLELESLRKHLCRMSDGQLLRFGQVTKHAQQTADANGTVREWLALQLQEARKEWDRRKPDLPLRGSF